MIKKTVAGLALELKRLKVNADMSEETLCFSADLWVNGVKTLRIGNRGCGGDEETYWYDRTLEQTLNDAVATLPPIPLYADRTITAEIADVVYEMIDDHQNGKDGNG